MEEAGLELAIEACRARVEQSPDDPDAYLALADLLLSAGRPGVAAVLGEAMRREGAVRDAAAPKLARLLAGFTPRRQSDRLEADLMLCLESPAVEPQMLARVAAAALLLRPEDAEEMGTHRLWVAFLIRCINVDPAMEARLVRARRVLATSGGDEDAMRAIAIQAFAGEYCWPIASDERPQGLAEAMYRAVDTGPGGFLGTALHRLIIEEPAIERELAEQIPVLGGEQAASAAVRSQYEANPYPRWREAPESAPVDLAQGIAQLPGIDADALPPAPFDILIAGCGTGYEAIDIARTDPRHAMTAIDLSSASLGFAKRKAEDLAVRSIDFRQGDLLALPGTGLAFDLIVSTGVLHHLESPGEGLAALASVLRPGGVIRLGLYSARARSLVAKGHGLIAENGWQADADGIRAFRAHILSLPDSDPLAALRGSDDFYSLSGCRDLFFHACEHWFTPPEIAALVADAGLKLVAFDAPPEGWEAFEATHGPEANSLHLALWDHVEIDHPDLFAGMYQFWCQKPRVQSLP